MHPVGSYCTDTGLISVAVLWLVSIIQEQYILLNICVKNCGANLLCFS